MNPPMNPKRFNQESLPWFNDRFTRLHADSERQWGTLTATGMLAHLSFMMELSLGKRQVKFIGNPITRLAITRKFVMEWMPWPKGKIKAPRQFTPKAEGDFDVERERLLELCNEFCKELAANPNRKVENPVWGPITLEYWSVIHGRHTKWHLKQFGIED